MTSEELKKQNEAIAQQLHREWLQQPMTKALNGALQKHEISIVDRLCMSVMDKDVSSEYVRLLAAQLSTTRTIKNLINATATFVAKCSTETDSSQPTIS